MADRSRKNWKFEAIDGLHHGTVLAEHQYRFDVRISMQDVNSFTRNELYLLADTGSPHYVTEGQIWQQWMLHWGSRKKTTKVFQRRA